MVDEVTGNIIAEFSNSRTFGGFIEDRMWSLLEGMWDKVEYALKDSQKSAGQLEECFDSKVMQSVLNGRTFKYHFWVGRFHVLPQSYTFSHGLCLNNSLHVLLIFNQRDHVPPFRYINQDDGVSHLVRVMKVLGYMKYLMRSVKLAVEEVGIWTEENRDVKRVN